MRRGNIEFERWLEVLERARSVLRRKLAPVTARIIEIQLTPLKPALDYTRIRD